MKANQAFRNADEAVSPVIGVILMVAITVVLAAIVFVLVTRLAGGQKDQSPTVTFDKQVNHGLNDGGTLTVVAVNGGPIPSTSIDIGGTANCVANFSNPNVQAGDRIVCSTDGSVTVTHTGTNTLLYQTTFPG